MQDLHAAPRWSKTAVIVVLVVFGLVLLVAAFGLLAFTSQRDRDEARARENAFADGRSLLEKVPGEIDNRLVGLLQRAYDKDKELARQPNDDASKSYRQFLEGDAHGWLARFAWRVGTDGRIDWLGGRFVVWDRRDRIDQFAESQSENPDTLKDIGAAAEAARQSSGPLGALGHWARLATEYGLAMTAQEGGRRDYPFGLASAKELVTCAADAASADPASVPPSVARDAALRALEVESLNRIRKDAFASYFDYAAGIIDAQIARLLDHLPEEVAGPLAWEIDAYRASRAFLAAPESYNYTSLITARNRAQKEYGRGSRVVVHESDFIFGVNQFAPDATILILLDRTGIEKLIASELAKVEDTLRQLGLEVRWMPQTEPPRIEGFEGRSHSVQFLGPIQLPYQLAIFQTGDPRTGGDGFTNLLFWVVIGLAIAGLITGGFVLVRLLTREIRLARLKADFVSNLSHELKTPITSMLLFTEMLEDGKLTSPEDQEEAFSVLGQESRRLRRIVNRMIDVARGEARQSPYNLRSGDLNRPVLEAATRFQRIVTEPGLDLHIQLHPGRLPVKMDLQAMDDAVTNLLSNAWKYRRGDRARIVVRTAQRGRLAEIVVADDGIGIPRADRRKVFEMFYRSEQYLTHPVAGTGLGLALVRSVVAGHKGRVELRPGEGGMGSVFAIRIPIDASPQQPHEQPEAGTVGDESQGEHPAGSSGHGKVEAAHDEPAPSGAVERGSTA